MTAKFIRGYAGNCFVSICLPGIAPSGWVLCYPPFAEEMNKSRKVVATQARALAASGLAVVIPDLYGTGDSTGDFSDADWDIWRKDMLLLIQWIKRNGGSHIHFWGIRLGALLALDVCRHTDQTIASFLLWQPVCNGQQASTQFLRLRMAAGLMDGKQEKVSGLREQLEQGRTLEVAGYEVAPRLIKSIDQLSTQTLVPREGTVVHWLEVGSNTEKPLAIQSKKTIEVWREAGVDVHPELVRGDAFWGTQEISVAPDLIQRSSELLLNELDASTSSTSPRFDGCLKFPHADEVSEIPVAFDCHGSRLPGIVHHGQPGKERGVLVVVGGPQYRIGSHRQFVLLARTLSEQGYPVFRFDYRGMGDGEGSLQGFEAIGDDIHSAINCFQEQCPGLREIVIWGLCDAATAASFYASNDDRVKGLVLLNPWVRSKEGEAQAYMRHYYLKRLLNRSFWQKILNGSFDFRGSLLSFWRILTVSIGRVKLMPGENHADSIEMPQDASLARRVELSLQRFKGNVLLILSENDLTAAEFNQAVQSSSKLKRLIGQNNYRFKSVANADHTFSRRIWRNEVAQETADWLKSW